MEQSKLDPSQVLKACRALVAYVEKKKSEKEKTELLIDDETVFFSF